MTIIENNDDNDLNRNQLDATDDFLVDHGGYDDGDDNNNDGGSSMVSEKDDIVREYECRIEELGNFMELQGRSLDSLTVQCQKLLVENMELKNKNNMSNIEHSGIYLHPTTKPELMQNEINKKNESCKERNTSQLNDLIEENELLIQQSEHIAKELDTTNSSILDRDKIIDNLRQMIESKLDLIKKNEERVLHLTRDRNTCQRQLGLRVDDITHSNLKIKELEECVLNEKNTASQVALEIKGLYREKNEFEKESDELSKQGSSFKMQVKDLQDKLTVNTQQYDRLYTKELELSKELALAKKESQRVDKVMIENEQRLTLALKTEASFEKFRRTSKMKTDEAELSQTKMETTIVYLKKEIDSLTKSRGNDLKIALVSQENETASLKKRYYFDLNESKQLVSEVNLQNAYLNAEVEKMSREKERIENQYQKLNESTNKERVEVRNQYSIVTDKLKEVEIKVELERLTKEDTENDKLFLEGKTATLQDSLVMSKKQLSRTQQEHKMKQEDYVEKHHMLGEQIAELQKKTKVGTALVNKEKESFKKALHVLREEKDAQIKGLKIEINQLRETSEVISDVLTNQSRRHTEFLSEIKSEKKTIKHDLEIKLRRERQLCQRLMSKHQSLIKDNSTFQEEKLETDRTSEKNLHQIALLSQSLRVAHDKIALLGKRLSENLSEQQERIRNERCLKSELQNLKLQFNFIKNKD